MTDIVERIKDAENTTHALFNHIFQDAREEIERLRAKIEQMEQQEPSVPEDGLPDRDFARPAEQQGLFRKFVVRRTDNSDAPDGKHYGCRYFVLDVDHDKHAAAALTTYAADCETTHPELAKDLREKWGAQPAPSINEGVRKVTLDFRWESEAQHHIPTIEIEFEPVSPESPNDAKSWQDRDRLAAMLTPEAKP